VVKCIALRRMNAASSKKADPYVIGKAAVVAGIAWLAWGVCLTLIASPTWVCVPPSSVQVEDTVASTGVKEHTLEPIYNETFSL
jgi:hypothetical protein